MSDEKSAAYDYDFNQHDHSRPKTQKSESGDSEIGEERVSPYANAKLTSKFINFFDKPVTWFREKIVLPNQKKYPWYHERLRRVPTIDQCYTDDELCVYEADQQYRRDREVDSEILNILRYRMDDCVREEYPDYEKCFPLKETYLQAAADWFTKYGDLGAHHHVRTAYMKQKHRLLWERRHGPVGTGMKRKDNEMSAEDH